MKRHFRDRSGVVRVPRSAKELHLLVRRASDELSHELSRSPTVDEIAEHLQVDRDDVMRGLAASAAYNVGTLDVGVGDGEETATDRQRALAIDDAGFENAENREVVLELLDRLPEREREIVRLRFYERMSQAEIGEAIGVSQMHVSRLLRRSFEQMRDWIEDPAGDASADAQGASSESTARE